jgi:hypothetical protein
MTAETSTIYLLEVAGAQAVEAQLVDAIEEKQLVDWQTEWQPALFKILQSMKQRQVPMTEWPQSWHWNWRAKISQVQDLLGFQGFSVVCEGLTQGLMRVDLSQFARLPGDAGKPLVFVDYLEAAPWNRPELGQIQRYKGVGTALISAAVKFSVDEGFKGRIGLHSLPQSETFYRDRCGMIDLGSDSAHQNLKYFEMTPAQASAFLADREDT